MFVAMSQSELLRLTMNEQPRYISRAKVRDSSEQTAIVKARSSGVDIPNTVLSAGLQTDARGLHTNISTVVTIRGKGTNMDYDSVLERAQSAAICADISPSLQPAITLYSPVYSRTAPPFSQQTLSTAYTAPCKIPGNNVYFPPFLQRGQNGDSCNYRHLPNDSA
jgi:hypothetical protein